MFGRLFLTVCLLVMFGGIAFLYWLGDLTPADVTQAQGDMVSLGQAFIAYHQDTGVWPPNWDGQPACAWGLNTSECLFENTSGLRDWRGPYLVRHDWVVVTTDRTRLFQDPWGYPYVIRYFPPGDADYPNGAILIHSSGPDGQFADTTPGDDIIHAITRDIYNPPPLMSSSGS